MGPCHHGEPHIGARTALLAKVLFAFVHGAAVAQEPPRQQPPATQSVGGRRVIEEITVTAQKREQTLQEVPISLSVVSTEFMTEQNISDFRDLSLYVPNVSVSNNAGGLFNDVRIRGFGSPIGTKSFEQPVGLVIDGIPYTRLPYWQAALFDLERVEVLRGPQGTLFGKNTTAGLFNVVTTKPTDEFTGYVEGELGELDARRFEAAIGGPLVANVANFRISGLSDERDGIMENTTALVVPNAPDRMNSRDRKAVRAQLAFPDVLGASLLLGYETAENETNGTGWEMRRVVPQHVPFFRYWDPNADFEAGNWVGSMDGREKTRAKIDSFVANGKYDLAGWGLDLVAGYSVLEWASFADSDLTPAVILYTSPDEDENPQTVVELRANSPSLDGLFGIGSGLGLPLGRSDFTVGFFFDRRKIEKSNTAAELNAPVLAQEMATDATGVVPPCPGCESQTDIANVFFDQSSRSLAGFTHLNWHPFDRWTIEYGMRFTDETKDGNWQGACTKGTCAAYVAVLGAETFTQSLSRSEFLFTPKVTLRYDWTDDIGFYGGWGQGSKAGGFNGLIFNDNNPPGFAFDAEKAASWELGSKMNVLDGTTSLGIALYRQTVTDLQVFVVTPDRNLTVANAGEARSQGVEVDLTWLPTDWLTVRGASAFNDSKYLEFPDGGCTVDFPNTDGDANPQCDHSGRPFEFTPRWTSTVTPSVAFPLSGAAGLGGLLPPPLHGVELGAGLSIEYKDNYYADDKLDARSRQPSFIRLGGNLGVGDPSRGWSLRLVGQNLTDEPVAVHIREVAFIGKSFAQILDAPRLISGVFRYQF